MWKGGSHPPSPDYFGPIAVEVMVGLLRIVATKFLSEFYFYI